MYDIDTRMPDLERDKIKGIILYDENLPYRWLLQVGGASCVEMVIPGIYIPLEFDVEGFVSDWEGLTNVVNSIHDSISTTYAYHTWLREATNRLFERESLPLRMTNPPSGYSTHEACLWVEIYKPVQYHSLHPFAGRKAVLTWDNSD